MHHRTTAAGGWTLREVVAAVAILAMLVAALAVSTREGRRQASLADNFANLKHFAYGVGAYAADHDDRVPTFTWRAGVNYGFGGVAPSDDQAAANQAVEIIRRRGGRTDMPQISGWIPHILYSHLVLVDYLDADLPAPFVAAPEDSLRRLWQENPVGLESLPPDQRPPGSGVLLDRWAYSSSYELGPAFFSADAAAGSMTTVSQANAHNLYVVGAAPLGGRRVHEVRFPAQKAMLFEQAQRHFGPRHVFYAYASARTPALAADGSTRALHTAGTNHGFQPNTPLSLALPRFDYRPGAWEPPTLNGSPEQLVTGHYRWTRSGLRGRDWGGPEVPWVP